LSAVLAESAAKEGRAAEERGQRVERDEFEGVDAGGEAEPAEICAADSEGTFAVWK